MAPDDVGHDPGSAPRGGRDRGIERDRPGVGQGARGPTETDFFDRADMTDTKLGQAKKDDPAYVAHDGYEAFVAGKDHVVAASVVNRLQTAGATALPDRVVAAAHARTSEPGSGSDSDSPDPDRRGEAS